MPAVEARLKQGAVALDVGCGSGRATITLATAFPNSRFDGCDAHAGSVDRARANDVEVWSLETGKRADMIFVRLDRANAVPLYDPVSQMVYALKAEDVRDVMVNGRPVVGDGKILTLDERAILAKAAEFGMKVKASLK